ncbi:MAG TPA: aryl-sulfate sulfotransferase [Ktedonobacteraceae bacterium]|nr:aryl-sulfate sulfotransferase [Ktedonobacteraceae bacterium]
MKRTIIFIGIIGLLVLLSIIGPRAIAHVVAATPGSIVLTPSVPAPQPVGTSITWTAQAVDNTQLVYRFRIGLSPSGPFVTVRDFSPRNTFTMAPLYQSTYFVQVTVQEGYSSTATASTVASYAITSRVQGNQAVVTPTANPLVALYSAPSCSSGQMYVAFQAVGATTWQDTGVQPCSPLGSMNFLVAGMQASTTYRMESVVTDGTTTRTSTPLLFTTGTPAGVTFPTFTSVQQPGSQSNTAQDQLVHLLSPTASNNAANPVATTLDGKVTWYVNESDLTNVWPVRMRPLPSTALGSMTFLFGTDNQPPLAPVPSDNVFRTVDLAGNPLQETNIEALNVQLATRGDEMIYGFGHEALPLPNGNVAVLGFTERTINGTPLVGDMLIVLNPLLQVVWTWDAFDHLDTSRRPTLGDTCAGFPPVVCPVPGYPNIVDWTHANAIAYSPTDGNLLVSLRNQDWVVKINYSNGSGDGRVLWRLGKQGDFSLVPLNSADPYPWFSHQHNPNYIDTNGTAVEIFDNGNVRCNGAAPGTCDSRGQVYQLNEQTRVATQTLNSGVGVFAMAQGTAQRLTNGNFNFTAGLVISSAPPHAFARDVELLPDGSTAYVLQMNAPEYRAWRLSTLYSSLVALT